MTFFEFAAHMAPYWCFGGLMFWAVWKSKFKDLLAFDKKSFTKFFLFMVVLTIFRIFLLKFAISHGIGANQAKAASTLPLAGTLFTPWEDLCHSLPLAILRRTLGGSKWMSPIHFLATLTIMTGFFVGHVYEGIFPALLISFYIPWAVSFGQKKGFGTIMTCHVLYDFLTLGIVKLIVG